VSQADQPTPDAEHAPAPGPAAAHAFPPGGQPAAAHALPPGGQPAAAHALPPGHRPAITERPEVLAGAAFAGAFVVARVLKRIFD
jgi:hypothetical protein